MVANRSPINWRFILFWAGVLLLIASALWIIVALSWEALAAFLAGVTSLAASFVDLPPRSTDTDPQRARRNRQAMLQLVKKTWINGVLEQSPHTAGMEERKDAVERPWDMILQASGQPNRMLPAGTRMVDVFDKMGEALLILGAPGSGKTTMLLDLARDAIARAEQDPAQPIPVVFNLSSWTDPKQPLAEWLVEELSAQYYIPRQVGSAWVQNDELILLFDI